MCTFRTGFWLHAFKCSDYFYSCFGIIFSVYVFLLWEISHLVLAYIMVLIGKGLDSIVFTQFKVFPSYGITAFYVLIRCFSFDSYCCIFKNFCWTSVVLKYLICYITNIFFIFSQSWLFLVGMIEVLVGKVLDLKLHNYPVCIIRIVCFL